MENNAKIVDVAKIVTSQKLSELKQIGENLATNWQKTKYGSKEFNDAKLAMLQNDKEQILEIAAINKQEAENRLAVLRNERIKFVLDYKNSAIAANIKNASQELKDAEMSAYEALVNLVLPNRQAKQVDGSAKSSGEKRGSVSDTIHSKLVAYINEGKTSTEACKLVVEEGFSRGTTGAVRTQMVKDGEIAS